MYQEKDITRIMKSLDITRKEAIEVLKEDDDIEHNKPKDFDLTDQQMKNSKEATKCKRPPCYSLENAKKRERKPNEDKRMIIEHLHQSIMKNEKFENAIVTNIEKKIDFELNGNTYTIDVICHRKPKK